MRITRLPECPPELFAKEGVSKAPGRSRVSLIGPSIHLPQQLLLQALGEMVGVPDFQQDHRTIAVSLTISIRLPECPPELLAREGVSKAPGVHERS